MKSGIITPPSLLSRNPTTNVPQIYIDDASKVGINTSVPEIRINTNYSEASIPQITLNEEGPVTPPNGRSQSSLDFGESSGYSPIESPTNVAFGFAGIDPFADDGLRQRGPGRRTPPYGGTPNLSPSASPMISPCTSVKIGPDAGVGMWHSGGLGQGGEEEGGGRPREGSEVAPQIVLDALDDSEWRDQIRSFIESEMAGAGGMSRASSQQGRSGSGNRSPR